MDDATLILCAIQEGHIMLDQGARTGMFLDPALAEGIEGGRSFRIDLCKKGSIVDADTRRLLIKLLRNRQPCLQKR